MTKLHELLAVESDLSKTSERLIEEALTQFTAKADRYTGYSRSLTMFDENRQSENLEDNKSVQDTVDRKLRFVSNAVAKYYDALLQKEEANQRAKTDLIVDGVTIATDVPATLLLGLESRLGQIKNMINSAPTLRVGLDWALDNDLGQGIYFADTVDSFKTEKSTEHQILTQPTEHHPAQIDKWTVDKNVGRIKNRQFSGMLSPADKSKILTRLDNLIREVKKSRQRANAVDVGNMTIGQKMFEYIFAD